MPTSQKHELTTAMRPIEGIRPYSKNPRIITDSAVRKVAASIRAYGFRQPIVVDSEGVIIIGHVRLRAAKSLGLSEVPVHEARDLTAQQARALRLMDNRSHDEARWDEDLLSGEWAALADLDVDLSLTGFDLPEIRLPSLAALGGGGEREHGSRSNHQSEPEADPDTSRAAVNTQATIGEYRFAIPRDLYLAWQEELRQAVGFDQNVIVAELQRRLGLQDGAA